MNADNTSNYRVARWFVGLGVIALGGSFLVAMMAAAPPAARSDSTPTAARPKDVVERRAVAVAYVDVEGGVRQLNPTRAGRIVEVIGEGVAVKKGDVLLRVDDRTAKNELKRATDGLKKARLAVRSARQLVTEHDAQVATLAASVEVQKADQRMAEAALKKARRLFADKEGARAEDVEMQERAVEKARAAVTAKEVALKGMQDRDAKIAVETAEADVAAAEEAVELAKIGLDECVVKAPADGEVLRAHVRVGEAFVASPQRPALEFGPAGALIVRAEVEQEFAGKVAVGLKATIKDDSTGKGDWSGAVKTIGKWYTHRRQILVEPAQFNDVRTLEVLLSIDPDPKRPLRIGQKVLVTLE